jgi:hypothetical protein
MHGIRHLSASSINTYAAEPALWVMERLLKRSAPVGCAAHRGTAIEAGVAAGLQGSNLAASQSIALRRYDELTALSGDPKRQTERDNVAPSVATALGELLPYGTPTAVQRRVVVEHPDLPLPLLGFTDFEWDNHGITLDLKTSSKLASAIPSGHARQGSVYIHGTNRQMRFCYVTPKKVGVYVLENADEHFAALIQIARRMERFLRLSKDPAELAGLLVPNLDSFYWNDPVARAHAREVYGF